MGVFKSWSRRRCWGFALLALAYALVAGWVMLRGWTSGGPRRTTVRLVHFQTEGGVRAGMAAVIDRYEKLHPDVRVVQMVVPGGMFPQWLQAQLAGGTVPDIVEYGSWFGRTPELQRKYFEPLDRWLDHPNPYNRGTELADRAWRNTFLDGLENTTCYNPETDQYFGISLCTGTLRVFYNRRLLQTIQGTDEPPRDYRAFMALCEKIRAYARTRQSHLVPVAGSKDTVERMSDAMLASTTMKLAYGMDRLHRLRLDSVEAGLGYLQGEWHYHDPAVLAGLELARNFCHQLDPGAAQLDRDSATTKFANEDAVMFSSGSFDAMSLQILCPFPVGAFKVPYPTPADPEYGRFVPGPFSDGQVGTSFNFYLRRDTAQQAAAIDFMQFMTSQAGAQLFCDTSNWLPGVVGVQPTEYSRQYMPDREGYGPGASFSLLAGPESFALFKQTMFQLVGPSGSPEKFADAMEESIRGTLITDLNHVMHDAVQNLQQEDVTRAARHYLAQATGAPGKSGDSESLLAEAAMYRNRRMLVEPEPKAP